MSENQKNFCETCKFRIKGECTNPNIIEDFGFTESESEAMLIYSYTEGGKFRIGPKFGCVHHESKEEKIP